MPQPTEFGHRRASAEPAGVNLAARPRSSAGAEKRGLWKFLFSFEGRIPRLHYWLAKVGSIAAYQLIAWLAGAMRDWTKGQHDLTMLAVALIVMFAMLGLMAMTFTFSLSIQVRRWHDRDKSWPWALLGFIPIVGWLWQDIECGFLEGTLGPNRFGPSPKGIAGMTYEDLHSLPAS